MSRWPVYAGVPYAGSVKVLVGSWKDRGRTDASPVVVARLREVVAAGRRVVDEHLDLGYAVWVVPAPSTPSAVRRRGRQPTTELARVAAEVLSTLDGSLGAGAGAGTGAGAGGGGRAGAGARRRRPPGAEVRLVPALVHRRRRTLDQAGLGARDRASNLSGALRVRRRHRRGRPCGPGRTDGPARQVVCVLVDDVLTTGATLAECERALLEEGRPVVLGLVLAAAPRPGSIRAEPAGRSPGEDVSASSQGLVVHSGHKTG